MLLFKEFLGACCLSLFVKANTARYTQAHWVRDLSRASHLTAASRIANRLKERFGFLHSAANKSEGRLGEAFCAVWRFVDGLRASQFLL